MLVRDALPQSSVDGSTQIRFRAVPADSDHDDTWLGTTATYSENHLGERGAPFNWRSCDDIKWRLLTLRHIRGDLSDLRQ